MQVLVLQPRLSYKIGLTSANAGNDPAGKIDVQYRVDVCRMKVVIHQVRLSYKIELMSANAGTDPAGKIELQYRVN